MKIPSRKAYLLITGDVGCPDELTDLKVVYITKNEVQKIRDNTDGKFRMLIEMDRIDQLALAGSSLPTQEDLGE